MSYFNFHYKNKYKAGAVEIIGGAHGPTAVITSTLSDDDRKRRKEEHENFLEYAAKNIAPCDRAFKQLEQYLIDKYEAVPYTLLPHELDSLKANVILNFFDYVLDKPEALGENPTEEEIIEFHKKDTSFLQAREYPAGELGLEFKVFRLPNAQSVIKKRKRFLLKKQPATGISSYNNNDVIVEMEMKSEYLCVNNGSDEIADDILVWQGVSKKNIEEKSPRFIAYAYALKQMGKI